MSPRLIVRLGIRVSLIFAPTLLFGDEDEGRPPQAVRAEPTTAVPRRAEPSAVHRPIGRPPLIVRRPSPAAGAVLAAHPLDLAFPYGVIFDTDAEDLWIGDIGGTEDFPGDGLDHRYLPDGTPTGDAIDGRELGLTPMDGAYNPNTRTLWQISGLFGIGCVYELDAGTRRLTFRSICPPFETPQDALAYDAKTDTYYSGSLDDAVINHFDSSGRILDSIEVVAHVSGLAFNPVTGHLFLVHQDLRDKAGPDVFVVDPRFGGVVVGGFYVGQPGHWGPGMRGMEIDCDGNLWLVSQPGDVPYLLEVSSGEPAGCAAH